MQTRYVSFPRLRGSWEPEWSSGFTLELPTAPILIFRSSALLRSVNNADKNNDRAIGKLVDASAVGYRTYERNVHVHNDRN